MIEPTVWGLIFFFFLAGGSGSERVCLASTLVVADTREAVAVSLHEARSLLPFTSDSSTVCQDA